VAEHTGETRLQSRRILYLTTRQETQLYTGTSRVHDQCVTR